MRCYFCPKVFQSPDQFVGWLLKGKAKSKVMLRLSRRRISVSCHAFQLSMDNIYYKMEFGLKPYNFEPEYTEEELLELATASDENSGNDDSSQQTCRCTHCRFQTAIVEEEKTCCVDNDLTVSNLEDYCCITDQPSFHTIVLNRTVLEVAYIQSLAYKRSHVTAPSVLSNRYVPLSLSVFWGCYKNGGGEGRCVVPSACRLNVSGKGTCKLTQLLMKQTSKLSSVICKVRIRSQ